MAYKRILTIQDISCVGQCSMTVALPILAACGHEVCILPSKLLSTHTGGFGKPAVRDLTEIMPEILAHWQNARIRFDAIYTGYLGSVSAVHYAARIMDSLLAPGGKIIVDPALADHGKLYAGLNEAYAQEVFALCARADVILPNITEAAMMTGLEYRDVYGEDYITALLDGLQGSNAVITGVGCSPDETGAAVRCGTERWEYRHKRICRSYHGTGDVFAACFTGAWMRGRAMSEAVAIAGDVTCRCIENTHRDPAHWYGVRYESALPYLMEQLDG